MAKRPVFIVVKKEDDFVKEDNIEFKWFSGYAVSQKQKSIESLQKSFLEKHNKENYKILEISSKSSSNEGVLLSAFNLSLDISGYSKIVSVENVFQSSKVFESGGPFLDILNKTPIEAKRDERLRNSGEIKYFEISGRKWFLEPKTMFYDWLYINAVSQNRDLARKIIEYDSFTDIEFNPQKSYNCQARSAALFVSLYREGLIDFALQNEEDYKSLIVKKTNSTFNQISLFE